MIFKTTILPLNNHSLKFYPYPPPHCCRNERKTYRFLGLTCTPPAHPEAAHYVATVRLANNSFACINNREVTPFTTFAEMASYHGGVRVEGWLYELCN